MAPASCPSWMTSTRLQRPNHRAWEPRQKSKVPHLHADHAPRAQKRKDVITTPNWCHNTLTVSGESEELARFVEVVRPDEESLRRTYDEWDERWEGKQPEWEEYVKETRARQPLSFETLSPQPPNEELRGRETYRPCTMCGAHGILPESEIQAAEHGASWFPWMAEREERTCNVCSGSKEERVGSEGWYLWRVENWGTKWDASFSGPFLAFGRSEIDLDLNVGTQGSTTTPTVAIYKFDTPWSPPAPWVASASEQFPDLEFVLRYGEVGNDYAGQMKFVAGMTIEDKELEIDEVLAPEEKWF